MRIRTAQEIQRQLERAVVRHRENTNLSDSGRRKLLAAEYKRAQGELLDLQQDQQRAAAAARRAVESQLFGLPDRADPALIANYRDASDRAARVGNATEAKSLLRRAHLSGDTVLARAIVGRAFEEGWPTVVDDHVAQQPEAAEPINALMEINYADQQARSSPAILINRLTYAATRPHELDGLGDGQIEALAKGAPDVVHSTVVPAMTTDIGPATIGGIQRLAGDTIPGADGWL